MEEGLDNPAPQESGDDGESRLAQFLAGNMDDDGRMTAEVPQSDSEEEPTAQKAQRQPEEPKAEEPQSEEPEYEVKVNGETKKVKLSELRAGYQKGEDYTAKTERLAEERRQVDALAQQAAQERQMYLQNVKAMQAQLAQAVRTGDIAPPDESLIDADPVEYLKQQQRYAKAQQMWGQLATEQQQVMERQRQEDEQRFVRNLAAQKEQLLAKLPHWSDKEKMQTEVAEMKKFLKSEGYSDADVDSISDHRAVSLARKAMLYDQLMANKQATESKLKAAPPKAIRSGTTVEKGDGPRLNQSAMTSLRKTGSVDDAARIFRSLMG